jgi:AcrR family transcriptional regulator
MARTATREAVLAAGYSCIARFGVAKTSIADVATAAGVGRATVYRLFPGGREELLHEVVGWEYRRFFLALYEALEGASSLEEVMETGLVVAHQAIAEHEVLQLILATEPAAVSSLLASELAPSQEQVAAFLTPYLERHELADGVEVKVASSFLARMLLSYIGSPGRWDLTDPTEVSHLVRAELLAGIVPAGTSPGR